MKKVFFMGAVLLLSAASMLVVTQPAQAKIAWNISSMFPYPNTGDSWERIVSSADGTTLYAYLTSASNGNVYKSTNGGDSWAPVAALGSRTWKGLDVSADGTKVVAANTSGYVYVSTNSGSSWATSTSAVGAKNWSCVGMSDDGSTIVSVNSSNNIAYVSTSTGSVWRTTSLASYMLTGVSCDVSADGQKFSVAGLPTDFTDAVVAVSPVQSFSFSSVDIPENFSTVKVSGVGDQFYTFGHFPTVYRIAMDDLSLSDFDIDIAVEGSSEPRVSPNGYSSVAATADGEIIFLTSESSYVYSSVDDGETWRSDSKFGNQVNGSETYAGTGTGIATNGDGTRVYLGFDRGQALRTLPGVSNLTTSLTSTSTLISWNSSRNATSSVSYGFSTGSYPYSMLNASSTELNSINFNDYGTTTHSVLLSGLVPCATYNFRYVTTDIYENTTTSSNNAFKLPGCFADAEPIQSESVAISNLGVLNMDALRLVIPSGFSATTTSAQFEATELPVSAVSAEVSNPPTYRPVGSFYQLQTMPTATTTLTTFTEPLSIVLEYDPDELGDIEESSLTIFNTDGTDWEELSSCVLDIDENTITCPTEHFSVFGVFGSSEPSVISNIQVDKTENQATITWNTDRGATSVLRWGTDSSVSSSVTSNSSFASTTHAVALSDLEEGETYYYQVVSVDVYGIEAASSIQSFTMPSSRRGGSSGSRKSSRKTERESAPVTSPVQQPVTPSPAPSVSLQVPSLDLMQGNVSPAVAALQRLLNARGFAVAQSGPGSAGSETEYFGPATAAALRSLQASLGLPATGFYGPMTRAALSGVPSVPVTYPVDSQHVTSSSSAVPAIDLRKGDTSPDVAALQRLLNARGFAVSVSGPGSAGNETELFGLATEAALKRLQSSLGLPSTGFYGPMTRAALEN